MAQALPASTNEALAEHHFQEQLDLASRQRHEKNPALAAGTLIGILETNAPAEFKRKALFELALATQDQNESVKAQQIFAQYRTSIPPTPARPKSCSVKGCSFVRWASTPWPFPNSTPSCPPP